MCVCVSKLAQWLKAQHKYLTELLLRHIKFMYITICYFQTVLGKMEENLDPGGEEKVRAGRTHSTQEMEMMSIDEVANAGQQR